LEHADVTFKDDWGEYQHVTDSGILREIVRTHKLDQHEAELTEKIKTSFIRNINSHLVKSQVQEVPGANTFINNIRKRDDVAVAIATGGWGETARLKLKSAGINVEGIPLCSANDAISRVDIMTQAKFKASHAAAKRISYFGDASWDKKACAELGWNFISVGDRITHTLSIDSFQQSAEAMTYCTS
jgi:hypothetical protein